MSNFCTCTRDTGVRRGRIPYTENKYQFICVECELPKKPAEEPPTINQVNNIFNHYKAEAANFIDKILRKEKPGDGIRILSAYIDAFPMELDRLLDLSKSGPYSSNLVLGGSVALQIHGLSLGRIPEDLDLVFYGPTKEQGDFVKKYFKPCIDYSSKKPGDTQPPKSADVCRVYEMVKGA